MSTPACAESSGRSRARTSDDAQQVADDHRRLAIDAHQGEAEQSETRQGQRRREAAIARETGAERDQRPPSVKPSTGGNRRWSGPPWSARHVSQAASAASIMGGHCSHSLRATIAETDSPRANALGEIDRPQVEPDLKLREVGFRPADEAANECAGPRRCSPPRPPVPSLSPASRFSVPEPGGAAHAWRAPRQCASAQVRPMPVSDTSGTESRAAASITCSRPRPARRLPPPAPRTAARRAPAAAAATGARPRAAPSAAGPSRA